MKAAHINLEADFESRQRLLENPSEFNRIVSLVDQTLLKPEMQEVQVRQLVTEAVQYNFRAVCIPSGHIAYAKELRRSFPSKSSHPALCTVIGFPLGHSHTATKTCETAQALEDGADEFDYVQNISWVRDGHWDRLTRECEEIVARAKGKLVKVILETCLLSDEELYNSALAAANGGVHVLKTSTGFGSRGATKNDLKILNTVIADFARQKKIQLGLKASGGIRNMTDALTFVQLGATRLGTSAGVILATGLTSPTQTSY